MLELINEQNIWDNLKQSDKPIVLYGMGLGAEKIMAELEKKIRDNFSKAFENALVANGYFAVFVYILISAAISLKRELLEEE